MQKPYFFYLFFLLFLSSSVFAQNFTYSTISVESVTFGGGNLNIRKDNGTGSYTSPQWNSGAASHAPVAYVSGSKPMVSATFEFDCANAPDSVTIMGIASDSMEFPPVKVALGSPSGTVYPITYPGTATTTTFASNVVRFFKPFTIDWQFSFDDGTTWREAGTTENTLYVTKGYPRSEGSRYKWFHTVYDLSCRNAQYESVDTAIIARIWSEFVDHIVLNAEDDSLHYYKTLNSPHVTLASLLQNRDAECYTFAQLFLSAIYIQGINRTNNYVYITPINNLVCGRSVNRFLVKDWAFGTPTGAAECADFPWKNTYTSLVPFPYTAYNFITADVTDQTGIPGSCTANPASFFNNHQITLIDGVYYDPCYGVTFNSVADIPTAAFSGWGFRYYGSGVYNAFFTNDMSKSSLSATVTTFN